MQEFGRVTQWMFITTFQTIATTGFVDVILASYNPLATFGQGPKHNGNGYHLGRGGYLVRLGE